MSIPGYDEIIEPNDQTEARREHLEKLRELVGNVYPNKFDRSKVSGVEDTITNILHFAPIVEIVTEIKAVVATLAERERPPAEIKDALNARLKEFGEVCVSGRMTTPPRGNFVHLTDGKNKIQIYAKKAAFALVKNDADNSLDDENGWEAFSLLDHGDFIGVSGFLFLTNTGELSVHVEKLQFLAKAMVPMPDKMHGIANAEIKQRQRYVDLIGSSLQIKTQEEIDAEKESGVRNLTTREVFEVRAKTISSMRNFLEGHGYIEVETPMLTPKATGAAATPFVTHHNALDITLYARIAPELYLKRLTVGGFEKVYELNRNFRNEGISYKHNPEFTMLEFYCAYMDVEGMMNFCEEMLRQSVLKATSGLTITYYQKNNVFKDNEPKIINFEKFDRLTMREAISQELAKFFKKYSLTGFGDSLLDDPNFLLRFYWFIKKNDSDLQGHVSKQFMSADYSLSEEEGLKKIQSNWIGAEKVANEDTEENVRLKSNTDNLLVYIFDEEVESKLVGPTFIVDYPKSISPLSKASPENPQIAERFELFVNGMEVANGFSELNDPREQYERFRDQMSERERGDEEAMIMDEDYIRALSYGMPPAAGIGIGIDRLVMLLTNKHSIRDVILFPHMRPERKDADS